MQSSINQELDIQENLQKMIQKAKMVANAEGCFNRETFVEGDQVWIQNPTNRKWDKKGIVKKVRKWNDTPLSYVVETSEGVEYLKNGKYLCHTVLADFPDSE